ncbi:MAG TPA: glycosyltransferase family 4 protein [Stellaceae bacterium]|nr:glycosyltransferase family 4 protein [Stellaceae bacterium]
MARAARRIYKHVMASPGGLRGKLIFLVTEDWYFWSHRLPMARAARDAGFAVAVATRVTAHGERIRAEGFALHPLRWRRGSRGLLASLAAIIEIGRLYRRERPLVVHHVALKAALFGGIAARVAGVPGVVSMIAGTGYLASASGLRARLAARLLRRLWPILLLRRGNRVIVQNEEDRTALAARRPEAAWRIAIIAGSGVDLAHFRPASEPPAPPVVIAYAGRMIAIKGVAVLVAAHALLQQRGLPVRLVLAGAPDPENPSAIDRATLTRWATQPDVTWLGHQDDVRAVWRDAHIAVLASLGGEGLPKTLLEAAAMGRPIVATDVPGTRSIARDGENAMLVPPGDAAALADALAVLAGDPEQRRRYGAASRALVENGFSEAAIGAATVALYDALCDEIGAGAGPGKN